MNSNDAPVLLESFAEQLGAQYSGLVLAGTGPEARFNVSYGGVFGDALYDLASLTKPFVATTALWLAARGEVDLEEPVFAEACESAGASPTLAGLLRHEAGAIPWWPLYATGAAVPQVGQPGSLLAPELWRHVRGVYSDIGYMTAGRWIEHQTGQSLRASLSRCCNELLGTEHVTRLLVGPVEHDLLEQPIQAATIGTGKEVELARKLGLAIDDLGPPPPGLSQDGNARWHQQSTAVLPGHAGLFGSIDTVLALARLWLTPEASELGELMRQSLSPPTGRLLGWFRSDPLHLGKHCWTGGFHHTGFTGGAVWVEPELGCVFAMLADRRSPFSDLSAVRCRFRQLAVATLT